jgi:hypothetical protein
MGLILGLNNDNSTGTGQGGMSLSSGGSDILFEEPELSPQMPFFMDAYSVRGNDLLTRDNQPADAYTIGLYVKSNNDLSVDNNLRFSLTELGGDTLPSDEYKLDFDIDTDGDGAYDFNLTEVITADQMRAGYDTQSWTQEIKSDYAGILSPGEYGRGTIEAIPEPSALALILLGGVGMIAAKRLVKSVGRRK